MADKKPKTLDEYLKWLKENHHQEVGPEAKNHYQTGARSILDQFEKSSFWEELTAKRALKGFDEEYRLKQKDYPLLLSTEPPSLCFKDFDSFLAKTFRINVLQNKKWPQPPALLGIKGWILPPAWMAQINDIVRTCFIVKYFDGVKYLAEKLRELAYKHNLTPEVSFQAREEGYYAAHLYVCFPAEVVTTNWATEVVTAKIELQITTQLQEVIRQMLHLHYEERRMQSEKDDSWKWEYKNKEFATNYLGHILHYLEGMIAEIRDRPKEND